MGSTAEIEGVQFEWFGECAVRVQAGATVVYVDPHPARRLDGCARADLVLITHAHPRHLDPLALRAVLSDGTAVVANLHAAGRARAAAPRVVKLQEGQRTTVNGVEVRAVPGYNHIHPRGFNTGFVFRLGGLLVYHAGDTALVPEMAALRDIDVALVPIGGAHTMGPSEAAAAVGVIQPRWAIPMACGSATRDHAERFRRLVGAAARVVVL
ncbi:MAG TPA: MBL fold metallo-hydrolase [Dehalococcoidia bacterium]